LVWSAWIAALMPIGTAIWVDYVANGKLDYADKEVAALIAISTSFVGVGVWVGSKAEK
jgi:hypothetical protein